MNGWVKLHRKIIENKDLMRNPNLLKLFIVLLSICGYKTGQWSGGRFQLAEIASMGDSNTYKTLKRLKKLEMVTLRSNNKYTTISIVNWSKYQQDGNTKEEQQSNNKVTTKVTLLKEEERNKEIKNKIREESLKAFNRKKEELIDLKSIPF